MAALSLTVPSLLSPFGRKFAHGLGKALSGSMRGGAHIFSNSMAYGSSRAGVRRTIRATGLIGVAGVSAIDAAHKVVTAPFPKTYTVSGFGSGFGMHGSRMRHDGGIGATGDLVLSSRPHGRF